MKELVILDLGSGNKGGSFLRLRNYFNYKPRFCDNTIIYKLDKEKTSGNIKFNLDDCDKKRIPLPDKSVDIILIFGILEYIQNLKSLFQEIKRLIKTNGVIYGSVANPHTISNLFNIKRDKKNGKNRIHVFGYDEIKNLFWNYNFRSVYLQRHHLDISFKVMK